MVHRFEKKFFFITVFLFLGGCFSHQAFGFEYEMQNKVDVITFPIVTWDIAAQKFSYWYKVFSSKKSVQNVETFDVVTYEDFSNVKTPYGWDFGADISGREFRSKRGRVIKFEIPRVCWLAFWTPNDPGWYVEPNHGNIDPSPHDIKPGESVSGFSFESSSLPGITNFYSVGFRRMYRVDELPPGFKEPDIFENSFKGVTVGPVAVADKSPPALIERLISLNDEVPKYEWITDPQVTAALRSKFEAVRDAISSRNLKAAKDKLTEIISDLDAEKGKKVHDNAWALLKANCEYLIWQLDR